MDSAAFCSSTEQMTVEIGVSLFLLVLVDPRNQKLAAGRFRAVPLTLRCQPARVQGGAMRQILIPVLALWSSFCGGMSLADGGPMSPESGNPASFSNWNIR